MSDKPIWQDETLAEAPSRWRRFITWWKKLEWEVFHPGQLPFE